MVNSLERGPLPVLRVERSPTCPVTADEWPGSIPAVGQLLARGLDLGPLTVLVGENGSGKSTLVEGIAMAYGLNAEGGSTHARHSTRPSESPLGQGLRVVRGIGASNWGFFLRAETMHGLYTYLERDAPSRHDPRWHEMSHGESFLAVLRSRFDSPGLYVLDEPESALSFTAQLGLVGLLHDLAATGTAQVIVATHSPVVASIPGARILQIDDDGWHETTWEDLDLVQHYRAFLQGPQRYLRHVIDG